MKTNDPLGAAYEQFVLNSPMGIHIYELDDDRLVFAGANPAADIVLGVDNQAFVGKTIEEAFPPLADTEVPQRYREAAANGTAWQTEQVIYQDRRIQGAFEVHAFQLGEGRMAAMFLDITERKRSEEERERLRAQIQHAQKLESLGVLAGGIAHDFNNLLAGVLGNASVALAQMAPEALGRSCLLDIQQTGQRATELVNQLLAYSGRGRFVQEAVDLRMLVEEMGHLLDVSISKKVRLSYNFRDQTPAVLADPTQLRQIVMNLITNASDAIDEKGAVVLGTGSMYCDASILSSSYLDDELPPGLYSYIEVSDSGVGMDADTVEKIFDPFFSTKLTGRGLGMAAVLGIVRGHRGAVKVYSELGKGTTFKVLLPAIEGPATMATEAATVGDEWRGSGTVLLVDDSDTVRDVGSRMLGALGFDVVVAEDGARALELFRAEPQGFRCVLLDMTMPELDGEACFRELRAIRADTCVILSSGYNEQDLVVRFAGKGLAGFIQKPYTLEALRAVFVDVLDG